MLYYILDYIPHFYIIPFLQVLCRNILEKYFSGEAKTQLKVWQVVKDFPAVLDFIKAATRVSFAMVLHKPQIDYKLSKDKYLGRDIQELYWNSVSPETERYHVHNVFPAICRGDSVLVKGKVYLKQFSDESSA